MNKTIVISIVLSGLLLTSCLKKVAEKPPCFDDVSYSQFIKPEIIDQYCIACHGETPAGNTVMLTTHELVSQNASAILTTISLDSVDALSMPYFQSNLNDTLIEDFRCWLNQGKLNN